MAAGIHTPLLLAALYLFRFSLPRLCTSRHITQTYSFCLFPLIIIVSSSASLPRGRSRSAINTVATLLRLPALVFRGDDGSNGYRAVQYVHVDVEVASAPSRCQHMPLSLLRNGVTTAGPRTGPSTKRKGIKLRILRSAMQPTLNKSRIPHCHFHGREGKARVGEKREYFGKQRQPPDQSWYVTSDSDTAPHWRRPG